MNQERDKMKHLLIILLEALSADPEQQPPNTGVILDKAEAAGLEEEDVHGLLDWIGSHMLGIDTPGWAADPVPAAPSSRAFRHFGEDEARYLAPEAMGYLLRLLGAGQINRAQLEALLAYASYVAYRPLEVEDFAPIIEQVLFRPGRPGMTGGASDGPENLH